ncbi:MAG: DUF255 domain-containing protein [Planctomycetota bacterium]
MSRVLVLLMSVFLLGEPGGAPAPHPLPPGDWLATSEEAFELAAKSEKLVLLDFTFDTCSWCHKMDADSYPDKEVQSLLKNLHIVKVNRDKRPDLVKRFSTDMNLTHLAYPCRIYLNSKGEEVDRAQGYKKSVEFKEELSAVLAVKGRLRDLTQKIEAAPKDKSLRLERIRWATPPNRWDLILTDGEMLLPLLNLEDPADKKIWEEAGVLAARSQLVSGNHELAIKLGEQYLALFPQSGQVMSCRQLLGVSYERAGNKDTAAIHFAAMLASDPKNWHGQNFFKENPEQLKRFDPQTFRLLK